MTKYFLGLIVGSCLAWSIDIIYTPGLNKDLGVLIFAVFVFIVLGCLYDSYHHNESYNSVVLFHAEVFLSLLLTLLFFFVDKFGDMNNVVNYEYYGIPIIAVLFCLPWVIGVIVIIRKECVAKINQSE